MSVIGVITVFNCDGVGCPRVACVHTDAEIDSFAANWYSGYELHFCPACRYRAVNSRAIERDEAEMNEVCRRLDERCSTIPSTEVDYAIIH
jgi:hypothetical protein